MRLALGLLWVNGPLVATLLHVTIRIPKSQMEVLVFLAGALKHVVLQLPLVLS